MKRRKASFPTSDETRSVLSGKESAIAKVYGCDPSYIFGIKNNHEPDPYPIFRAWFSDCAFGGGNVREYLHDLEAIAHQAEFGIRPTVNLTERLLSKIDTDAKSTHVLAESIQDNYLDERECEDLLKACDKMKLEEQMLREMAFSRLNELRDAKKL